MTCFQNKFKFTTTEDNVQNTWILPLKNIYQIKSEWNSLQKIIKGPTSLSVGHW